MKINPSSIDFRDAATNNLSTWNVTPGNSVGRRITWPKLWVEFSGSGGTFGNQGISSVTDLGVGLWKLNYNFLVNSYLPYICVTGNHTSVSGNTSSTVVTSSNSSSVTINTYAGGVLVDPSRVDVIICSPEPIAN